MKSWLQNRNIKINSLHNEEKSVVAERFIRTLKNKIYKYMTSISKNVYIDIDNSTYHRTIKMKPVDVKPRMYVDFNKENNKKDPKFKVGNHVRILKYKNIFAKDYVPNWSEEVLGLKKLKILCRGHIFLVILAEKKLLERFAEKNCKKQIKKSLELKK